MNLKYLPLRRLLLQAILVLTLVCLFASPALAQTPGGTVPPITTAYVVTMVLGLVLGFLSQGVKTGNVLGVFKVQASWVPALAVVLTFGTGLEQGLSGQPTLTGAVWLNAFFTAALGLLGQAGGATLHGHTHWSNPSGSGGSAGAPQAKPDPVTAAANALPKPPASSRLRGLVAAAGVLAVALFCSGCLSSAPIVPVTPANQAQVTSCENTAAFHDDLVVGDFVLTGGAATLSAVSALETNAQTKNGLAIGGAISGGLAVVASSLVALSASNFANGQCSSVVGNLPAAQPAGAK